jgi:hypothetical protein
LLLIFLTGGSLGAVAAWLACRWRCEDDLLEAQALRDAAVATLLKVKALKLDADAELLAAMNLMQDREECDPADWWKEERP